MAIISLGLKTQMELSAWPLAAAGAGAARWLVSEMPAGAAASWLWAPTLTAKVQAAVKTSDLPLRVKQTDENIINGKKFVLTL
jgi:hypothetical protein